MTRIRQRTTQHSIPRSSLDAEQCFEESQALCDRILARAATCDEVHAYAAGLVVRAVEAVLPAGERALFLTHLARNRQAHGHGPAADLARSAVAGRLDLPAADVQPWLAHLSAVPTAGPGRAAWLFRHLHRILGRLGISSALEGELARALAWRYLTTGLV